MGGSKSRQKEEKPPAKVPMNGSQMNRVNETDQAILDLKARQRKIRTYESKMQLQEKETTDKIKELLKEGNKNRALIFLKKKKFLGKELDKTAGAMQMLQETLQAIESAQADIEIMKAMKSADATLKELQSQAKLEEFEELYESHKENLALHDMECELFGEKLDDDLLNDELDQLVALDAAKELGELGPMNPIIQPQADANQEEKEEVVVSQPKKKLVAA